MKFVSLTSRIEEESLLQSEYARAYAVGKLRLGQDRLYFRAGLKTYYISYSDIHRYFRRVTQIPARLCCGKGVFEVESLVICDDRAELAQIELPGTRAAKVVMSRMAELAPNAAVGPMQKPPRQQSRKE